MRRLPALAAALLLPAAQPLLLCMAASNATLLVSQAPAHAQSAEAVAKVAQAITVRIEGATQGSGVLVKRDGNRYTVLTAWHVVSGQRPGEELDIYTPDGQRHQLEQGSITRWQSVDLATLNFASNGIYKIAKIGSSLELRRLSPILVGGFPIANTKEFQGLPGGVVANTTTYIDDGYQLGYSAQTSPGISGGPVVDKNGLLVAIHGRGQANLHSGSTTSKTGLNWGIPVEHYLRGDDYAQGAPSIANRNSAQYYLVAAEKASSRGLSNSDSVEVIRIASEGLKIELLPDLLFLRASSYDDLGESSKAYKDLLQYFSLCSEAQVKPCSYDAAASLLTGNLDQKARRYKQARRHYAAVIKDRDAGKEARSRAYFNLGNLEFEIGEHAESVDQYSKAIGLDQEYAKAYSNRANARRLLGDQRGAFTDYAQAIANNPSLTDAYYNRGTLRDEQGDMRGAMDDLNNVLRLDAGYASGYTYRGKLWQKAGHLNNACSDYRKAAIAGDRLTGEWLKSKDGAWCRNIP